MIRYEYCGGGDIVDVEEIVAATIPIAVIARETWRCLVMVEINLWL